MSDKDLIREAVEEALEAHEKRRAPCASPCPLTADDVAFLHRIRGALDKVATGVGMAVILSIAGGVIWLIKLGIEAWRTGAAKGAT